MKTKASRTKCLCFSGGVHVKKREPDRQDANGIFREIIKKKSSLMSLHEQQQQRGRNGVIQLNCVCSNRGKVFAVCGFEGK